MDENPRHQLLSIAVNENSVSWNWIRCACAEGFMNGENLLYEVIMRS